MRRILFAGILVAVNITSAWGLENASSNITKNPLILHINGYSYHFVRAGQNELNYGGGFSYGFTSLRSENWFLKDSRFLYEFDAYKDSYNHFGYSTGFIWQRPLIGFLDGGLRAGIVHEDHAQKVTGLYLIPYVLPFIESNFNFPVNIRATILPPLGNVTHGLIVFQLMLDIGKM